MRQSTWEWQPRHTHLRAVTQAASVLSRKCSRWKKRSRTEPVFRSSATSVTNVVPQPKNNPGRPTSSPPPSHRWAVWDSGDVNAQRKHEIRHTEDSNPTSSPCILPFQKTKNKETKRRATKFSECVFSFNHSPFGRDSVWQVNRSTRSETDGRSRSYQVWKKIISLHSSHSTPLLSLKFLIMHAHWRALWHRGSELGVKQK